MTHDLSRDDPVWCAAALRVRARRYAVPIPLSFRLALRLPDLFPQASRDACRLAILRHDIGWAVAETRRALMQPVL